MARRRKGQSEVEKKNSALKVLKVEYVPIGDIAPNSYNPNRQSDHDFELLLRSMREDGFTQPIVCARLTEEMIDEDPNELGQFKPGQIVIVDGEHRWRAASVLEMEEVPVVITDMSLAQARIATLRHNRARGSEDYELSAQVLRDLEQLGVMEWAQDSLMLEDTDVERLLSDAAVPELLADEEFSEAWAPSSGEEGDVEELADRTASSTPAAMEARRNAERKLVEAHSEEEKRAIRRDMDVHRLAVTFSGDEGVIVKAVTGSKAAAAILQLCREHLERAGLLEEVLEAKDKVLAGELVVLPDIDEI
jgi:ParB-like chromosome segregation protein Spo0J